MSDKKQTDKQKTDKPASDGKAPNYTEAFQELQAIVTEIENGEISVDQLSEKVKRAALLIRICKDKLTATEGDVNQVLKELESKE